MELHQLRYALAVQKSGNFSRAAEQCHVSQPSLSQQIQKLESELGVRLFTRLKRNAVPTPAGRALLERAAKIFAELDMATREVKDHAAAVKGSVKVGILPTIAPYLLPQLLAKFSAKYPTVDVIVHETMTSHLVEMAASCELDIAILSLPITDDRLTKEKLFTEELLLALPPGHPFASRRRVRISDLESERFILLQEGHCLGDQAVRFCDRGGVHPAVIFRAAQIETILSLVAIGFGISLIPAMAQHAARTPQPLYVSLVDPRPSRQIGAVWRRENYHSRAAAAFLTTLRELHSETKPKDSSQNA
jgi:LysR family hydrogen peroxide-inducible transcriptional activator